MAVIRIKASQVSRIVRRTNSRVRTATIRGMQRAARDHRSYLARNSPRANTKLLRRSWKYQGAQTFLGGAGMPSVNVVAVVVNDAPYAGVMEAGARPHGVSKEGVDRLMEWARYTFKRSSKAFLRTVVWNFINRLRRVGYKGNYFVKESLPIAVASVNRRVDANVGAVAKNPPRPSGR